MSFFLKSLYKHHIKIWSSSLWLHFVVVRNVPSRFHFSLLLIHPSFLFCIIAPRPASTLIRDEANVHLELTASICMPTPTAPRRTAPRFVIAAHPATRSRISDPRFSGSSLSSAMASTTLAAMTMISSCSGRRCFTTSGSTSVS